jgi:lipoprotein-anchoring transpeptidase ErfK/SrfK
MKLGSIAALVLSAAVWAAAAQAAPKPTQEVVALLTTHAAFAQPSEKAAKLRRVQAQRPLTNERTVLPVLAHKRSTAGARWLLVRLPGRPNGHTGWIKKQGTVLAKTGWHIVVHTATRQMTVYKRGRVALDVKAVVGKPSTPTPHGEFFVEESLALRAGDVGAPFALALSARSDVFQEFEGGPGQIALHGLTGVGGVPGTAVSHGCVRLANSIMRWLVLRIGPGVPVTITA